MTTVSEVIDLTESPEARRHARVQASRAQVVEIIDIESESEELPPPAPSDKPRRVPQSRAQIVETIDVEEVSPATPAAPLARSLSDAVIDLSLDSPPSAALNLPALPTANLHPPPAANLPQPPVAATDLPPMDVDVGRINASPAPSPSRSPSLSELALPDTPTPRVTPLRSLDADMDEDNIDRKPLLIVDETEQKPLSLLLQNMTVSDRPMGGTLGPAWIRERYEVSGQMAKWEKLVEKQKLPKPLSRRKPEKTRFVGQFRKSFVVLPFVNSSPPA